MMQKSPYIRNIHRTERYGKTLGGLDAKCKIQCGAACPLESYISISPYQVGNQILGTAILKDRSPEKFTTFPYI